MNAPAEAWLLVVAIAAVGITAMLLTMAAAIRHGTSIIALEHRVKTLRAHHRAELIARGLIEPEPDELAEVEFIDHEPIDAPIDQSADEPPTIHRKAA